MQAVYNPGLNLDVGILSKAYIQHRLCSFSTISLHKCGHSCLFTSPHNPDALDFFFAQVFVYIFHIGN